MASRAPRPDFSCPHPQAPCPHPRQGQNELLYARIWESFFPCLDCVAVQVREWRQAKEEGGVAMQLRTVLQERREVDEFDYTTLPEGDGDDDEQRAKGGKDDGVIADSPQLVADLALDSSVPPDISL